LNRTNAAVSPFAEPSGNACPLREAVTSVLQTDCVLTLGIIAAIL
jgi:hypothetical protein